jgi:hypothetical protein
VGIFKKLKGMAGGVDQGLLTSGRLGRGVIVSAARTNMAVGSEGFERPVCKFEVEVYLDGEDRYTANVRQAVPIEVLAQIQPGATTVAVRVDPGDKSRVALDLQTEPPTVTLKQQTDGKGAAEILASGTTCEAVIVQTQPLGMKNPAGLDMHAFVYSVFVEGKAPYQVKVGNPVPAAAVPLLFPGSRVPAKVDPDDPDGVVADWQGALDALK